jgi:soluble lytic murein transglycosylase-like protein
VIDENGSRVRAITYKVPHAAPEGRPGRRYFELIREAARQRGLPPDYIAFLDRVETR